MNTEAQTQAEAQPATPAKVSKIQSAPLLLIKLLSRVDAIDQQFLFGDCTKSMPKR